MVIKYQWRKNKRNILICYISRPPPKDQQKEQKHSWKPKKPVKINLKANRVCIRRVQYKSSSTLISLKFWYLEIILNHGEFLSPFSLWNNFIGRKTAMAMMARLHVFITFVFLIIFRLSLLSFLWKNISSFVEHLVLFWLNFVLVRRDFKNML